VRKHERTVHLRADVAGSPPPGTVRMSGGRPDPWSVSARSTHPLAGPMYWACNDVLALAAQLALGATPPPASDLRRQLDQLFRGMQQRAQAGGIPPEDVADAGYAIMALFDEIMVSANWGGRAEWQASPLQYVYFRENTAGEGFFRRADTLMHQPHRAHVLLVYFLCLALGFEGRYAVSGGAALVPVYEAMGAAVGQFLPPSDVLSPHGEPPDIGRGLLRRQAPMLRVAAVVLGLAIVVFFVLRASLTFQVRGAVMPMREYAGTSAQR
jgi:type VI secretion system protein ImpK